MDNATPNFNHMGQDSVIRVGVDESGDRLDSYRGISAGVIDKHGFDKYGRW